MVVFNCADGHVLNGAKQQPVTSRVGYTKTEYLTLNVVSSLTVLIVNAFTKAIAVTELCETVSFKALCQLLIY